MLIIIESDGKKYNLLDKALYLITQRRGCILPACVHHIPFNTEADALGVGGHGGVGGVLEHVAVEGAILNTNLIFLILM